MCNYWFTVSVEFNGIIVMESKSEKPLLFFPSAIGTIFNNEICLFIKISFIYEYKI